MMVYEIASGEELPGSGDRWEELRAGIVPPPPQWSIHMQQLITATMSKEPAARPGAQDILMVTATAVQEMALKSAGRRQQSQPAIQPQVMAPPKMNRAPSADLAWRD